MTQLIIHTHYLWSATVGMAAAIPTMAPNCSLSSRSQHFHSPCLYAIQIPEMGSKFRSQLVSPKLRPWKVGLCNPQLLSHTVNEPSTNSPLHSCIWSSGRMSELYLHRHKLWQVSDGCYLSYAKLGSTMIPLSVSVYKSAGWFTSTDQLHSSGCEAPQFILSTPPYKIVYVSFFFFSYVA